jgi:hypothetical protein
MKENPILDIMAVCIALILTGPIVIGIFVMIEEMDGIPKRAVFQIVGLILLSLCAGACVGTRCVLEIIVGRINESFPTLSSLLFLWMQILLMFVLLLLLVFIVLCLISESYWIMTAGGWFAGTYALYSVGMSTFVSS